MAGPIKYVADLRHVREVTLAGTADLAFWEERLRGEALRPVARDGKALILIIAADASFRGIRFREVSFSVLVSGPGHGPGGEGAYLLQAFNSCRFFAFCERVFFSTPYAHGDVRVAASPPAHIRLAKGGEVVFEASMGQTASAAERAASRCGEEGWEGPVFLPRRRQTGGPSKLFHARLGGHTQAYRFEAPTDRAEIRPAAGADVLQALVESHFAGEEWAVRQDARHMKSKTYRIAGPLPDSAPAGRV